MKHKRGLFNQPNMSAPDRAFAQTMAWFLCVLALVNVLLVFYAFSRTSIWSYIVPGAMIVLFGWLVSAFYRGGYYPWLVGTFSLGGVVVVSVQILFLVLGIDWAL